MQLIDGTRQYSYDQQGRLSKHQQGSDVTEYQYDKNGNRTKTTQNGQTTTLNIDPASNREAGKTYDANGSLTDDGRQYAYRTNGRLQSIRNTVGERTVYLYNALGERVRKTTVQEETDYVYNEDGQLIGEYRKEGKPKVEYLWLGDIPVGVVKYETDGSSKIYYVESDQLNTPRIITSQTRKVMWKWDSEPFGSGQANGNPAGQGAFTYNLRFPGQYYDWESGLHYNYYRDYDPVSGRYVQSDPIGLEAGVNTYVYVGSDPLNFVDPQGLLPPMSCNGRNCSQPPYEPTPNGKGVGISPQPSKKGGAKPSGGFDFGMPGRCVTEDVCYDVARAYRVTCHINGECQNAATKFQTYCAGLPASGCTKEQIAKDCFELMQHPSFRKTR